MEAPAYHFKPVPATYFKPVPATPSMMAA